MSLLTEPWYPEDNELEHYGVLGMKWGVRRTPEQLGHRVSKEQPYRKTPKRLIDKGVNLKQELASGVLGRNITKSQARPRNQSSGATNLSKGEKVQHVSGVPFEKLRPGQLYVTADAKDNDMYSAYLGSKLKRAGFDPKTVMLELKTDLKAPSSKDQYAMFSDFLKDNRKQVESDIRDWLKEKRKDQTVSSNPKDLYDQFINAAERSSDSQKKFYDTLKQKGYNAVLDEHDITGSWMQAQKPLIIMDALNTVGNIQVSDLDVDSMTKALDRLIKS